MRGTLIGMVDKSLKSEVRGPRSEVRRRSGSTCHVSRVTCHGPAFLLLSLRPTAYSVQPKGFTLLEVLVALAVLAVALVGLLGLHNRNLLLTSRAERLSTATLLAREVLTRTQLEGQEATKMTNGDFSELHPGQYAEFRWNRAVRPAPVEGLWELRVNVVWGEREDERCELTLFTPLN